jgi:ankyrin repeat protein
LDHAYLERILGLAITSGNSMLVRKLLEKGIDPDFNQRLARCDLGAPIWEAISRRHSSTVQILISGGANIHVKKDGWTLLGYAANNRLLGVVQSLLAAGADPLEKSGPDEKAALEWLLCPFDQIKEGTIQKTREKIAKLLTDRYTDEQLKSEGPQILSLATKMGYRRLQQRLMKMGVSPPNSCSLLD